MLSFDEGTVGELLGWLAPSILATKTCPPWPPDAFALAGAVLQKSGGYSCVVHGWPPRGSRALSDWLKKVTSIGRQWRETCNISAPPTVQDWWNVLWRYLDLPVSEVADNRSLCEALLQIIAAADEAAVGAGIPTAEERDSFEELASACLVPSDEGASLCRTVCRSKIRVLPKQHTPRSGITMRSLTHHLALCAATDIIPHWYTTATDIETHSLNILLVPWPRRVVPAQFSATPSDGSLIDQCGFFAYSPRPQKAHRATSEVSRIVGLAEDSVGRIDGVILPELALSEAEHHALREMCINEGRFLICGVSEPARKGKKGKNYLAFDIPVANPRNGKSTFVELRQAKHHRWKLDRGQIIQYGLGRQLDPTKEWWESIEIGKRELNFVTIKDWLTLCVLVCEDLARPDPVGDIVRAVGPNLVLALLMDGPQLAARWPGRYATVLADDPGSSVLTLSSIGMVDLCRPPQSASPSRTVALWKDAKNRDPVHIDLPEGADALVLALTRDKSEEFTPDGRSDDCQTAYPALSGIYVIRPGSVSTQISRKK